MNKTQHPSNNCVLGAPKGWDQKVAPCDALAVTRIEFHGQPAMVSFWIPTREEMKQLAAGAKVALWVIGEVHPPVALSVSE